LLIVSAKKKSTISLSVQAFVVIHSRAMLLSLAATDTADTVLMRLVLLSSWTWFRTHHGPNGTGRGGRTAAIKFYELRDNLDDSRAPGGLSGAGFTLQE
jgi:hypothetical protein